MTLDPALRQELLDRAAEDLRVRGELLAANRLGGEYVPEMEAVHRKNAAGLSGIIARRGWPDETIAGADGAEAAWLIAQHAVGEPALQRSTLPLLVDAAAKGRIPRWHAAYLDDRIALQEGRPQRYGTQWIDDPRDGRPRPWRLVDAGQVDAWRAEVGLRPLAPIPPPGPDLPVAEQREAERVQRWWLDYLASRGWSPG